MSQKNLVKFFMIDISIPFEINALFKVSFLTALTIWTRSKTLCVMLRIEGNISMAADQFTEFEI